MLSTVEFTRVTGLSYREVDYWTRREVLWPERTALGSGTPRGYSEDEALVAVALARLRALGASLDLLRETAEQLRSFVVDDWTGFVFINSMGMVQREPCSTCFALELDGLALRMASA